MERADSIVVLNDESDISSCDESWTGMNSGDMDIVLDNGTETNSIKLLSESNYSNDEINDLVEGESVPMVNENVTSVNHSENSQDVSPPFDSIISTVSSRSELPVQEAKTTESLATQTLINHQVVEIYGYSISKPTFFVILGIVCAIFLAFVQVVHNHWVTASMLREQMAKPNSRVGQDVSTLLELLKQKESALHEMTTEFDRTKLELNELLNDFSVMNVQLEAKTSAYAKLNSDYETLKNKVKSLRNDLSRVNRQLHEKEAAYSNMVSEHERVKDTMSALLKELKRLKLAMEEIQYSSVFIPGIKTIRKIFCRILKLCPHLEKI